MNFTVLSRIFHSDVLVCGSYNVEAQELTVVVKGKTPRAYTYGEVPAETWVRLNTAESAGRYWTHQIVRNYPVIS